MLSIRLYNAVKWLQNKMRRSSDNALIHVQAYEVAIRVTGYVMNAEWENNNG